MDEETYNKIWDRIMQRLGQPAEPRPPYPTDGGAPGGPPGAADATFRVTSEWGGNHSTHAERCTSEEAIGIARRAWATGQPLDRVRVVDEQTGFTRDEISRPAPQCTCRTPTRLGYCPVHERDRP